MEDKVISGTCSDRFTREHFNAPATVEGILVDGVLSLIKRYPYLLKTEEQGRIFVDKARPSHSIHYVGQLKRKLFSNKYFVEGNWDISGSYLDEEGNPWYYTHAGDWEMRRRK